MRAGMIALPGIIDAHTCLWQTVLRGYVPDLWHGTYNTKLLPLRARYTPDDNFNAAYVGGFEMLSYGTTTVVDYCHNIGSPDYAPRSLEALKTDRHPAPVRIFVHDLPAGQLSRWRPGSTTRGASTTAITIPPASRPSASASNSIGAPKVSTLQLRFARELEAPSCIHVNEAGTIDKLNAAGLLGPDLPVIHGNLISNPELETMAKARMPLCFTPTADTQGHAGRRGAPRHRSRRRRGVRLRHPLLDRLGHAGPAAGDVQRAGLPRRRDGAQLLDRAGPPAGGAAGHATADAAQADRDGDDHRRARAGPRRSDRLADARQAGRHRADRARARSASRSPTIPAPMSCCRPARATSTR